MYERDRYENWDEYEEDVEEQDEEEGSEYEYEKVHQPTKEELEYLELRQKLKERIRKKLKKDLGAANAYSAKNTSVPRKDSYGSFFGPSHPVIAPRVIEESKTLLHNRELTERIFRPKTTNNTSSVPANVKAKSRVDNPVARTNGPAKKSEILKQTRDYSFLQSDSAKFPNPPPRNLPPTKTDIRPAQALPRAKPIVNDNGRGISNSRDGQKPVPKNGLSKPNAVPNKISKPSLGARKPPVSNHANGHSLQPRISSKNTELAPGKVTHSMTKKAVGGAPKPNSSVSQSSFRKPVQLHAQSVNRSTPSNVKPPVVQRKEHHGTSHQNASNKHVSHSSKSQFNRPPSKPSTHANFIDDRPKSKPKRPHHDDDESDGDGGGRAISMIRKMFGYNPNRFRNDEDDSDMEANFEDIMREERNSAKIARREDEEQLRMIEEEERRERIRQAKRRKLSGH